MTKDLGRNGNLFGGNMLAWLDETASVFAYAVTGEPRMVTLRIGETVFRKPARFGDIVHIACGNIRRGNTSISFDITATLEGGEEIIHTDVTFVAIDEHGNKKSIERVTREEEWMMG
jgi:acyl-CoA hydrolase